MDSPPDVRYFASNPTRRTYKYISSSQSSFLENECALGQSVNLPTLDECYDHTISKGGDAFDYKAGSTSCT
eukprot:Awhi_evm4s11653